MRHSSDQPRDYVKGCVFQKPFVSDFSISLISKYNDYAAEEKLYFMDKNLIFGPLINF